MVAALRDSVSVEPSTERAAKYTVSAAVAAMTPAGIANRTTRGRNPGRARRGSGARASTNPGMPTLRVRTSVRWRGRNGNSTPATDTTAAINTA